MTTPRIHLSSSLDAAIDPWPTKFLSPVCTLRCDPRTLHSAAHVGSSLLRQWSDPLAALDWMSRTFWPGPGRWVGYLAYDLGRLFENLPASPPDDLGLPPFVFTYCRPSPDRPATPDLDYGRSDEPLHSNFTREQYESAVARVIDYVAAGDVFQVNLSQRFTAGLQVHPAAIYKYLATDAPAPFGAYLAFDDFAIISNSPELFLRVEPADDGPRRITTRPIKGTRPRGPGMEESLRNSVKDQAELNMIVDLERNDLGRVCRLGSVKVTQPRAIETHPTVHHGVATIEGALRDEVTFVDLLRATFPGGSVTGAPKIRAMQIIDELEPTTRGPYCGAIGYLDKSGRIQFNVAIRTMIIKDKKIHIPVGGGIVADSNPADEYEETLVKAQALFAAAGLARP